MSEPVLPPGWAVASIGDVQIDLSQTVNPAKEPDRLFELWSVPSFASKQPEIVKGSAIGSNKQSVETGTVLLSGINPRLNRVWVVDRRTSNKLIASTEWIPFFPIVGLNPKYLAYYLHQHIVRDFLAGRVSGVGGSLMRVKAKTVADFPFPVAPTAEQARIVAEIEKQFTRLDTAACALKRVQANLKRYWASVLKSACEGSLVPTEADLARKEGRSYESGEQLLARILKERRAKWEADQSTRTFSAGAAPKDDTWKRKYKVFLPPDIGNLPQLPEGWTWASVSQVGEVQLGRQRAPQHHSGPYMRPYLRVANVLENQIDVSDVLQMNFTPKEFETFSLRFGDILLNEGQSLELVGRAAMYRDEIPGACFQKTLLRFRPATGVNGKFALFVFLAYLHLKVFQKISRWTTSMAHLTAERFLLMHFPLPPLTEQNRIVIEVERLTSVSASVQRSLADHSSRVARLSQSILKRAFKGELVSQDPSDEAASVLLERIRIERSVSKPVKKMPTTKKLQGVMEVV